MCSTSLWILLFASPHRMSREYRAVLNVLIRVDAVLLSWLEHAALLLSEGRRSAGGVKESCKYIELPTANCQIDCHVLCSGDILPVQLLRLLSWCSETWVLLRPSAPGEMEDLVETEEALISVFIGSPEWFFAVLDAVNTPNVQIMLRDAGASLSVLTSSIGQIRSQSHPPASFFFAKTGQ